MEKQQPSTAKSSPSLKAATGRDYAEWFAALDAWGARGRRYQEIAAWLTAEQGTSAWWAQKLIVEYEQDRGIRQPGARPDGTFTGGASKTVAAPVDRVIQAFTDPAVRDRWLPGVDLHERTPRRQRALRFDLADGSRLNVQLASVGAKTQVNVEQQRLADAAAAAQAKAMWRERLTTFKELVETPPP